MLNKIFIQGSTISNTTIKDLFTQCLSNGRYNHVGIAVAYATSIGFRITKDIIDEIGRVNRTQWLFGLDDYFTQPSAIELAYRSGNSKVRIAYFQNANFRFHPKIIWFDSIEEDVFPTIIVGSQNLTRSAFTKNVEICAVIKATSLQEGRMLRCKWKTIWGLGHKPETAELLKYKERFKAFLKTRKKCFSEDESADRKAKDVLTRDTAAMAPEIATTCWIEVGNITGFRQEQLEIKAEQALFFGLPIHEGPDKTINVRLRDGRSVPVQIKYRGNAMWRFNLPQTIPEVARGLRPSGLRSPFVTVFSRSASNGEIELKFILKESTHFRKLLEESELLGTIGKTRTRLYGWC